MCVTAQLRARDLGLPLPAAAMPISPWVDFEVTGGTVESNDGNDMGSVDYWRLVSQPERAEQHLDAMRARVGGVTGQQIRSFAERGYLVLPNLVSATRMPA